jgi:hypothetical protein
MTTAAAKARHPAVQWEPDMERLRRRVAAELASEGHRWPEVAATLLAARGSLDLDRDQFAMLLRTSAAVIAGVEDGTIDPALLSRPSRTSSSSDEEEADAGRS